MNATEACIALNMLPTVGPVRLRKLLQVFKEPPAILAAKRTELRKVEGIGSEVAIIMRSESSARVARLITAASLRRNSRINWLMPV